MNSITVRHRYRPEIDGLRAFAVLAVIINHINKDILPGGYLGVDIFFVISGYVITSSLEGRKTKNFTEFIVSFYVRRIKRIFPALIFFVVTTSVLICFFCPEPQKIIFTGISSLFGFSNFYLIKQATDYFAQSTLLNAFTHTWSLGVEEQFYIIFPLLFWFSGFGKNSKNGAENLSLFLILLSIFSLISFLIIFPRNQTLAYFFMPMRFWEIATGCLVLLAERKKGFLINKLEKIPPILIFSILILIMFLPRLESFSTLLIIIFASILIISLKENTFLFKLLTKEKIVYLGLISYPLYLWHWGILSISRWTIGIHWWSIPFQILVIYFLSNFSYKYIENPFRFKNYLNKSKNIIIGLVSIFAASLSLIGINSFSNNFYLGSKRNLINLERNKIEKDISNKKCDLRFNNVIKNEKLEDCIFQNKSLSKDTKKLFWVGSSHSGTLSGLIGSLAKENKYKNINLYVGGTVFPSLEDKYWIKNQFGERNLYPKKYNYIQDELENYIYQNINKNDFIVITNHLEVEFSSYDDEEKSLKDQKIKSLKKYFAKLDLFTKKMSMKEAKVIYFGPYPHFKRTSKYFNSYQDCRNEWFEKYKQNNKNCNISVPRKKLLDSYAEIFKNLEIIKSQNSNFYIFNTFEKFCPVNANNCKTKIGRQIYLYDFNHLNTYGGKFIYPYFSIKLMIFFSTPLMMNSCISIKKFHLLRWVKISLSIRSNSAPSQSMIINPFSFFGNSRKKLFVTAPLTITLSLTLFNFDILLHNLRASSEISKAITLISLFLKANPTA